jgi:hypothetical protein
MTTTLNSSVIREATYDDTNQQLTLIFQNGTSYVYSNVDESVFRGLTTADSAGRFFSSNISGRFTTTRNS